MNVYDDESLFGPDDPNREVTAEDRADPVNAGLSDEDIKASRRPAAGIYDDDERFGPDETVQAPAPVAPKKGFFRESVLDQLIGGYHEMKAGAETGKALEGLQSAQKLEKPQSGFEALERFLPFGDKLHQQIKADQSKMAATQRAGAASSIETAKQHLDTAQQYPLSPETAEFLNENSDKTMWEAFKAAPAKIITELGARSAAASTATVAAGAVGGMAAGPAGFAAGMGVTSGRVEYVNSLVEGLEARGINTEDVKALEAAVNDPKLMAEVQKEATIRAAVIGGVDALAGFVGSRNLTPFIREGLAREAANLGAQSTTQAALGAAGEAAGQAASGQQISPRQIAAEAAGEFVTAPIDVAAAAYTGVRPKTEGGASPLDDLKKAQPVQDAVVEAQEKARADVAARGGDSLDQEVAAALAAAEISSYRRGAHDITAAKVREAQRQLQVEADYAEGTAQSEEDSARAQIQSEAAARYEAGIPAPAQPPLEVRGASPAVRSGSELRPVPDGLAGVAGRTHVAEPASSAVPELVSRRPANPAAEVAEKERTDPRDADYGKAAAQRDAQVAVEQAAAGEPLRVPLSEFKTLAERRAAVKPAQVVEAAKTSENVETAPTESSQFTNQERPALPAPKTARFETNAAGETRAVSEAELEARTPGKKPTLTIKTREKPMTRAFEAAPRTLEERRAAAQAKAVEIDAAAAEAASSPKNELPEPTAAQRDAGNYKKGHVQVQGMDISIETPKGGLRTFKDPAGGTGQRRMRDHYGYIRRTEGADGDHVDVFVGDQPDSQRVFVVDQVKPDGTFDEHKAMVGYSTREDAVRAYARNYQSGWTVGPVTEMSVDEFKKWAREGDTKAPLKPDEIRMRRTLAQRRNVKPLKPQDTKTEKPQLAEGDVLLDDAEHDSKGRARVVTAYSETENNSRAGGSIEARRRGDTLQVNFSHVPKELRGARRGVQMMKALARRAQEEGLRFVSDTEVSRDARHLYDALERRGYSVHRNPNTREGEDGTLYSTDTRPVFEVVQVEDKAPEVVDLAPERRLRPREGDATVVPTTPAERAAPMRDAPKGFRAERENVPARLSVKKAEEHLKPLLDEVGRDDISIIAHPRDLPADLRTRTAATVGQRRLDAARGLYDPVTDTVHVFAENHSTPEMLMNTAVHEIVAHQGMRKLLGTKYGPTMLDIFKNAKSTEWMDDFIRQHGLDAKRPEIQAVAADEYIASIAERQADPSAWEKISTAVRAVLRKLGIVDQWTDADLRRLLVKSRSGLREASAHGRAAGPYGVRLADGETERPKTPDNHPNSQLFKMSVTAEDQSNYNPGFVRARMDTLETKGANAIPGVLALIPRRNLPDFMPPGSMPSMQAYVRQAQRLDGRRNELLQGSDTIASKWLKFVSKNKDAARILGELMHAATIAGVDPAAPYIPKFKNPKGRDQSQAEAQRRGQHAALKKHWDALPGDAKALYIDVREAYAQHRDLVMQGLENRINAASADGKTKQALIAELRKKFEAGRVAGPYFPLARFGKYWAVAKDAAGEVMSYARFENLGERRAWVAQMKKEGHVVETGVKSDEASIVKRIDPNFVAKIASMLDDIDPSMADDVWQQYLRALPEMSMRKHFIHRKGRLGFTADALRAFANQQFHSAHQIAKLEHQAVLDSLVEQIAVEAKKQQGGKNEIWAQGLADEFSKRNQWAKNPTSSLWATKLTGLGFAFYLGLTPAAALVNLTQTAMVAFPTLAAKYNWLGAGTELTKAAAQWAGARGSLGERLRGDEQAAFKEAQRIGLFEKTMSHDLAGLGDEGTADYGSTRQKISNVLSWAFHKTEEANRQVTYLAAYRLARKKGLNHEQAILSAEDLTWDSHFDYANVNRPRVLQNDAAKVLLLFRQYSLNMTYRLARDFNDSLRGATKEQKSQARQRFAGIMGQTFLFAGASGLPMFWVVKLVCDAVFGDEDEPYDTEAAMRAHLAEEYGVKGSHAIMDGPIASMLGVDLTGRVGLNGLWWREPPANLEGADLGMFYLKEAAGPLPSIAINAFEAAAINSEGFADRAAEKMAPKAIADALKMARYAREGVANKRGDVLIPREEVSNYELFVQGLGFTPDQVALQYEQNRAVKTAEQKIEGRRAQILNQMALARQNDDTQGWDQALAAMQKFNSANPSRAIDAQTVIRSAFSRARYSAESVNGIRVEPGLRYLHEKLNFTEEKTE